MLKTTYDYATRPGGHTLDALGVSFRAWSRGGPTGNRCDGFSLASPDGLPCAA
jgi:hypothetical protein